MARHLRNKFPAKTGPVSNLPPFPDLSETSDVCRRFARTAAGLRTDSKYLSGFRTPLRFAQADRVEMMARGSDGSYMNVMVGIESCPLKIETTRVRRR